MAVKIEGPDLLTTQEVAQIFNVRVDAVTRWARARKLHTVHTPDGPRYRKSEIESYLPPGGKP